MKYSLVLAIALLLFSCQTAVKKEDLTKLNGYWEIKQVELGNGETKEYKVNETIDFFEVKDNAGFRQKVMPQFDGTFKTNGIKESLKVIQLDEAFFLECKTAYGKWNEEIIAVEDSTLILKNKQNIIYTYKKFKPFSLK
ncbi:hypothetical protein [Flavobacterium sp.]|jgi:hypothetical protein|uniref:hypothetical protein n=1 Tax=Flavobacterium sp. TaxID=239 RepID=UPI0037BF954D